MRFVILARKTYDERKCQGNLWKTDEGNSVRSFADRMLCLALDVGEGMLKNGAEIYRVEESVRMICKSYGAVHVEVFAITSLIVASVRLANDECSMQMRRVYTSSYHLLKIEALNDVSRRICSAPPTLEEFETMIRDAKKQTKYPNIIHVFGGVLAASSFTIVFGGSLFDALVAAVMGLIVSLIGLMPLKNMNLTTKYIILSFFCGLITCLLVRVGIGYNEHKIMIGTIMLLIPGLAFGNSFRELFSGEIISGFFRLIQSCLTAVMIAVGFGLAIFLMELML